MVMQVKHMPTRELRLAESIGDGLRGGTPGESWVFLLSPGRIAIERADGAVVMETITEAHLRLVASETRRAITSMRARTPTGATAWTFPVLREHVKIARREGDILDVRYTTAQGLTGLWALVRWTPQAWRDIKGLKAQHVSVGIIPRWPDETGVIYGPLLWEVSLTTHPRAKNIGRIQDTLSLRMSEGITQGKTMDEQMLAVLAEVIGEQVGQIQTALMAEIATLKEQIAALTPAGEAPAAEAEASADEAVEAAEDKPADEMELSEALRVVAKAAVLRGLNLSERSAGAPPAPRAPQRGPVTVESIKAETGLTGKAAAIEFLKRTSK